MVKTPEDPPDFKCWCGIPHRLSCQWNNTIINPRVTFYKLNEEEFSCRANPSLTTVTQVGCAGENNIDPFSVYCVTLYSGRNKIDKIDNFEPEKYLLIEDPPRDFESQRIDGRVRLSWNFDGNHWLNYMYSDQLVIELLYKPYMQVGGIKKRFLGYEKDLQGAILLNDIPNSEVLELCVRVRKDDSIIKEWSPCSNTVILRTISIPTTPAAPIKMDEFPCDRYSFCSNETNDIRKKDLIQLFSAIVIVSSIILVVTILVTNWNRLRSWLLPHIPEPMLDIHLSDSSDNDDEYNNVEETQLQEVEAETVTHNRVESCIRASESRRSIDSGIAAPS